jgi:23S rRNA (adenine2503-C2)-methyltransferase
MQKNKEQYTKSFLLLSLSHSPVRAIAMKISCCPTMALFLLAQRSSAFVQRAARGPSPSFGALRLASTMESSPDIDTEEKNTSSNLINLYTIPKPELEAILQAWGHPKYRAEQVWTWIRQGVNSVDDMANLPKKLRQDLSNHATFGSLSLSFEDVSKDGTRKRAYQLHDGQLIESVLMPYDDGKYTACISSQAGCAMACVFCATGQMGFARQLTPDEIFEQVARFSSELAADGGRLSNIVFMGMGEPLANYRNVRTAVNRITKELGIGARKITISTVGVVPNIRKLTDDDDMPPVRLAVSLHNAKDDARTALMPANGRYGGLDELMGSLKNYIDTTGRRVTLEWALIEGQNDTPQVAAELGQLIKRFGLRKDMVHVNVIPLNPTGGFAGSPSGRKRVDAFINTLVTHYGIACTPRMRRGIDIDAGCGQLKAKLLRKEKQEEASAADVVVDRQLDSFIEQQSPVSTMVGVYQDEDDEDDNCDDYDELTTDITVGKVVSGQHAEFIIADDAVDFESDDYEDPEFETDWEKEEAARLIAVVHASLNIAPNILEIAMPLDEPTATTTTKISDEEAIKEAKRRRKKLLKNIKAIGKLRDMEVAGTEMNGEQLEKMARYQDWMDELESVEHNLK